MERKTLPHMGFHQGLLKIRMCPSFPMDFPWCFRPAATSVPEFASTSVQRRLRHSPGRAAA